MHVRTLTIVAAVASVVMIAIIVGIGTVETGCVSSSCALQKHEASSCLTKSTGPLQALAGTCVVGRFVVQSSTESSVSWLLAEQCWHACGM